MSKQAHDLGERKRRHRIAPTPEPRFYTTDRLAAELVRRGLASSAIIDRGMRREDDQ